MSDSEIVVEYGTLDDIEFPPILYKYRDWSDTYHKRFITEKEVFLASPKSFEDELDCHNPTRFDLLTNQQIYDYFLWASKEENPDFTRQQHRHFARDWAKHSRVRDKAYAKKFEENSIIQYYEHEGILSLTENWDNDKMWDKYANKGTGICIGYDTRTMFENLGGGGAVTYVDELPVIMPEPFMRFEEAMRNRVYYKLKKWDFEEEYRTKHFWPDQASIEDRQIKLPKKAFKKIIFGDNIDSETKEVIINQVKKNIGEIEMVERKNAT